MSRFNIPSAILSKILVQSQNIHRQIQNVDNICTLKE